MLNTRNSAEGFIRFQLNEKGRYCKVGGGCMVVIDDDLRNRLEETQLVELEKEEGPKLARSAIRSVNGYFKHYKSHRI